MNIIFVVGMAGSGKSSLVGHFTEWLKLNEQNAIAVNLDPGVTNLQYNPDIDVRNQISLEEIMDKYQLGPNGALIVATDLIGDGIEIIRDDLEEIEPDIVLVDTPGQIELFALRNCGPFIVDGIANCPKAIVYLFDGLFSSTPLNYISNTFLAAAIHSRLLKPQVHVLTKQDLLEEEKLQDTIDWSDDHSKLIEALDTLPNKTAGIIGRDLSEAISRTGMNFDLIPISSKREIGFIELHAYLTRILLGGDEPRP
jgi:GTPase SAR1 family protein